MADTVQTGLLLLVVGMSTVLVALVIVVYTGKALILAVNTFTPKTVTEINPPDVHISDPSGPKIAAITGAVHSVTGGKGRITHIERLE
jgi:oxaloacetate decarboxylase gamma subunit